ncbi:MAG: N-6 DNA methylase [Chloroflexi bacterium]|nr:N-6 DNA methylase [Chloroflexota bacterium]
MLDSETKRRIDSARDILVGKVPDPKSQVEQITIALIYKFMDDMDRQSIEMGGKASFFKGEFKKYGWGEIFNPRMGGVEMLNLYGEAITRMSQNANLPELFRNIFKNAYLPYRDPETLKLFLKTINDFTYDHSEKLGDAFEYLLSVLGSQGDAGQFRTPHHIIDFMVQVVDPKKNETVLDPACGTAGFLISAYKHILNNNNQDPKGFLKPLGSKPLTTQEKQKIYENFTGYDISPDMVRLSLVNLYLHGFVKPQIHEYDSLASEERWNEYADVILANPPFMSPKGGIMPHKKFSVQSNRSEVLFVDYMAEHLTPNGRAAIIVPEGIIFQSAGAYKQLRKYLIENNFLWAVVSLPAGTFNPYSGVKTSILFLDKSLAKKTDKVLFVKVENDGFDLGAQRRPIDKNDLPETLKVLETFRVCIQDGKTASFAPKTDSALLVSISKLEESDYNLSADRYREVIRIGKQTHPMVKLGDICETSSGGTPLRSKNEYYENGTIPWLKSGEVAQGFVYNAEEKITELGLKNSSAKIFPVNTVLVAMYGATAGQVGILKIEATTNQAICGVFPNDKFIPEFLYLLLKSQTDYLVSISSGGAQPNISQSVIRNLQIPLPPLEIQRQLVDEIAAYQRIIDGARQVVEGWKPDIELELDELLPEGVDEWEKVKLENVFKLSSGKSLSEKDREEGEYPVYGGNGITGYHNEFFTEKETLIIGRVGAYCGVVHLTMPQSWITDNALFVTEYLLKIDQTYLYHLLTSLNLNQYAKQGGQPSISQGTVYEREIPLPPLKIQREIVARIETERAIVRGNRELIRIYEEKVKKVIERVWEG